MKFNAVHKKLNDFRNKISENGEVTEEDKMHLQELVEETIAVSQGDLKEHPKKTNEFIIPQPENDNGQLNSEQKFKLRIMERTGTGSASIH